MHNGCFSRLLCKRIFCTGPEREIFSNHACHCRCIAYIFRLKRTDCPLTPPVTLRGPFQDGVLSDVISHLSGSRPRADFNYPNARSAGATDERRRHAPNYGATPVPCNLAMLSELHSRLRRIVAEVNDRVGRRNVT